MKYVVLIGDGMSDYPIDTLNGKTPLQVANKPNMDSIASQGCTGQLKNVPDKYLPGSDVANMSLMGYDPELSYTGRGPLEAGSMGIKLSEEDVSFRCNFITEKNGILEDFNAGHITSEESKELIKTLNDEFNEGTFYPGVSYRHNFVYKNKDLADLPSTPPHDIVGEKIEDYQFGSDNQISMEIRNIMKKSQEILENHPVNIKRADEGKKMANMIWLWGQGLKPSMPDFKETYGVNAATITAVDLIKGLGFFSGMTNIDVPGATGFFDTDYKAKGKYAVDALKDFDFLFIHVEAPDEAGHAKDLNEKIKAIEEIDEKVLSPVLDNIPQYDDYKIAVLPDHPTPIDVGTHTRDPVPLAVLDSNKQADSTDKYDEYTVLEGSLGLNPGHFLINKMINGF